MFSIIVISVVKTPGDHMHSISPEYPVCSLGFWMVGSCLHWLLYPSFGCWSAPSFIFNCSKHNGLFQWIGSFENMPNMKESFSLVVWALSERSCLIWHLFLFCPRYSQRSSPTPKFKSMNIFLVMTVLEPPSCYAIYTWYQQDAKSV